MGIVLADYADRPDESGHRSRSCCRQARVRCDDADDKDRHPCTRGGAPRLRLQLRSVAATLGQLAAGPGSTVPNLGASGAIAAVMGAFLVTYPRDRIRSI